MYLYRVVRGLVHRRVHLADNLPNLLPNLSRSRSHSNNHNLPANHPQGIPSNLPSNLHSRAILHMASASALRDTHRVLASPTCPMVLHLDGIPLLDRDSHNHQVSSHRRCQSVHLDRKDIALAHQECHNLLSMRQSLHRSFRLVKRLQASLPVLLQPQHLVL